jgi:hypothetical protein
MTAAHIHDGPAGKNAGVFVPFTGLPGSTGGSFATLNSAPVAKLQDVLNNPPAFYVNVHTMSYPGGEIRGQLACAPAGEPVASPTATVSATPVGFAGGGGGSRAPLSLELGLFGAGVVTLGLGLFSLGRPSFPGGARMALIVLGALSLLGVILLFLLGISYPIRGRPAVPTFDYNDIQLIVPFFIGAADQALKTVLKTEDAEVRE